MREGMRQGQDPDVVQGLQSLFGRGGYDLSDDQLAALVPDIERQARLGDFLRERVLMSDEPATLFTPEARHAPRPVEVGETDAE